jgi:hypothetical protein
MFFLKCGVVTITQKTRGVLGHLDAGSYFGEMAILSSRAFGSRRFATEKRTCTVIARTIADVLVLHVKALEDVVNEFPQLLGQMLDEATKRLNELGEVARLTSFASVLDVAMQAKRLARRWLSRRTSSGAFIDTTADAKAPAAALPSIGATSCVASLSGSGDCVGCDDSSSGSGGVSTARDAAHTAAPSAAPPAAATAQVPSSPSPAPALSAEGAEIVAVLSSTLRDEMERMRGEVNAELAVLRTDIERLRLAVEPEQREEEEEEEEEHRSHLDLHEGAQASV